MNLWAVLGGLRSKNLIKGAWLGLKNPLYLGPTIRATRNCVLICTEHYGTLHHGHGPANAFRHALWNYMIAEACARGNSRREAAIAWAEGITLWHEDSFPNREPARSMDLHNNAVGRQLFREHGHLGQGEIYSLLLGMAENSVKIDLETDLGPLKNQLVYIKDHER